MAFVTSSARVNGETLGQFEGRPVILVGRIESQIDDNSYSLIATDKKQVTVSMPPGMSLSVGTMFELFGQAVGGVLQAKAGYVVSTPFDEDQYNEAIKLAGAFPAIFSQQ